MLQLKDIRWSTENGESILNGVDLTVPGRKTYSNYRTERRRKDLHLPR
ncbi:hypothetical protein [Ruminococcus sp. HUN007]